MKIPGKIEFAKLNFRKATNTSLSCRFHPHRCFVDFTEGKLEIKKIYRKNNCFFFGVSP